MNYNFDDIRPLKPVAEIKERPNLWPFIFILFILASVSVFIYLKRKRKILEEMPPPPPRPPEEIAREALEELIKLRLIEEGKFKEFYIRISDIIRNYIEGRYRIFALDRTTWELYQEMRAKKIERTSVDKIKDFLEECDLVKFAKYIPTNKETEEIFNRAREIVEITTPKPFSTA